MKPILFSASMIRAILSGRKTQTRRIIKPQPEPLPKCPYGGIGTTLWVRETWRSALSETHQCYAYRADLKYRCGKAIPKGSENISPWKPSIHMPKDAARIFLEISEVRVERLHDITEDDALDEGIEELNGDGPNRYTIHMPQDNAHYNAPTAKEVFQTLWQSINGEESWENNPWVWVMSFEKNKKC